MDFCLQVTIWWAGLMRGAVSMALAYNQVWQLKSSISSVRDQSRLIFLSNLGLNLWTISYSFSAHAIIAINWTNNALHVEVTEMFE